jgi:hypothetical protein
MIRFLFRSFGFVLLAAAVAGLVVDGTRSIAAERVLLFSFADTAGWVSPDKTASLKLALDHLALPPLRVIADALMTMPSSLVFSLLGLCLLYAGREPRPTIGYSSRA